MIYSFFSEILFLIPLLSRKPFRWPNENWFIMVCEIFASSCDILAPPNESFKGGTAKPRFCLEDYPEPTPAVAPFLTLYLGYRTEALFSYCTGFTMIYFVFNGETLELFSALLLLFRCDLFLRWLPLPFTSSYPDLLFFTSLQPALSSYINPSFRLAC